MLDVSAGRSPNGGQRLDRGSDLEVDLHFAAARQLHQSIREPPLVDALVVSTKRSCQRLQGIDHCSSADRVQHSVQTDGAVRPAAELQGALFHQVGLFGRNRRWMLRVPVVPALKVKLARRVLKGLW